MVASERTSKTLLAREDGRSMSGRSVYTPPTRKDKPQFTALNEGKRLKRASRKMKAAEKTEYPTRCLDADGTRGI